MHRKLSGASRVVGDKGDRLGCLIPAYLYTELVTERT